MRVWISARGTFTLCGEAPARRTAPTVGQGVQEIRIRDAVGAFRVIYVAKFAAAVYVLHCFQKKTQKTSKADLDVAAKRSATW
ncbi:hypothetical protein FHP25_34530 [Vineibacter terrae]|uniref:Type II toxin-antitoxin system RelE/ParE family toxin n=1 Tax=Vineibacter terrae TaxID=2586908 RepID=A0A5C8PA71_9HYPH|nr:hypothetical protein FHP25_34530 [Vineibacter terrae]